MGPICKRNREKARRDTLESCKYVAPVRPSRERAARLNLSADLTVPWVLWERFAPPVVHWDATMLRSLYTSYLAM